MIQAIRLRQNGGPEQMELVDVEVGQPGPGEIRIRHHAVGLNFIDVYQRTGLYPMQMPAPLGMEGAGIVEAVGEGVTHRRWATALLMRAIPPAPTPRRASCPPSACASCPT